jgi:uncharacterized protein
MRTQRTQARERPAPSKENTKVMQIFGNLPGKDFKKSIEFFTKLGFKFNPQCTDETATRMTVGEDIFVMLLTHEKFKLFTLKDICDATRSTEVLVCLALESRDEVDEWSVRRSPAAGPPTMNRRTADSCLATDFRTAMATSGD